MNKTRDVGGEPRVTVELLVPRMSISFRITTKRGKSARRVEKLSTLGKFGEWLADVYDSLSTTLFAGLARGV